MAVTLGIGLVNEAGIAGSVGIDSVITTAGTAPYTYQWYRAAGSSITPGAGNLIAGATGPSYASRNEPAGIYTYACKVTDASSATSTATITLKNRAVNEMTVNVSRPNSLPNYGGPVDTNA